MTQPRISTVYDLSNLRLHPDGLRVYQKDTNLRPDLTKITVQGPRETWIARDVGGSGKIPTNRKEVKDLEEEEEKEEKDGSDEEEEEFSEIDEKQSDTHEDEEEDEDEAGLKSGRKRKPKRSKQYAQKRQRFAADFDYLKGAYDASSPRAGPSNEANVEFETSTSNQEQTELELPDPSPVRPDVFKHPKDVPHDSILL